MNSQLWACAQVSAKFQHFLPEGRRTSCRWGTSLGAACLAVWHEETPWAQRRCPEPPFWLRPAPQRGCWRCSGRRPTDAPAGTGASVPAAGRTERRRLSPRLSADSLRSHRQFTESAAEFGPSFFYNFRDSLQVEAEDKSDKSRGLNRFVIRTKGPSSIDAVLLPSENHRIYVHLERKTINSYEKHQQNNYLWLGNRIQQTKPVYRFLNNEPDWRSK